MNRITRFLFKKELLVIAAVLVIVAGIAIPTLVINNHDRIIPRSIAKQITYRVFWPNSVGTVANQQSIKYDPSQGVLSFLTTTDSVGTTITEQASPSQFADIPDYFSKLIDRMNNYDTISTVNGNIYLTLAPNTTGETAVMNNAGTLLFDHANGNLSESDWRLVFNNLKAVLN